MSPKRKIVLQSLISGTAVLALLAHLRWGLPIDRIAFGLLVLAVLPWLSDLIVSAEFPGGWKVQFREVVAQQQLQHDEIARLKFLVSHFVTREELAHLKRFESPEPFSFSKDSSTPFFKAELRRLRSMGLIRSVTGRSISSVLKPDSGDLKQDYAITSTGKDYLAMLRETEKDEPEE